MEYSSEKFKPKQMKQKKVLKLENFKNESLSKEQIFNFQGGIKNPETLRLKRTYDWVAWAIDHEYTFDDQR